MKIIIDTDNLSELDHTMLTFLASLGAEEAVEEAPAAQPTKAASSTKKAAAPKAAPEPEPEPEAEEDLLGGEPTLADAVERATSMVSAGQSAKVKEALAVVGAKRVSEIPEGSVAAFLEALDA